MNTLQLSKRYIPNNNRVNFKKALTAHVRSYQYESIYILCHCQNVLLRRMLIHFYDLSRSRNSKVHY